jgi:hypothetical protein
VSPDFFLLIDGWRDLPLTERRCLTCNPLLADDSGSPAIGF